MPSKSKSQQHLFGMVHAFQNGDLNLSDLPASLADKIKSMASTVTKKAAKEFASTKTKNKPEHVTEAMYAFTFIEYLMLENVYNQLSNQDKAVIEEKCNMEDEQRAVKDTSKMFRKGQHVKWKGKSGTITTPNGKADLVGVKCDTTNKIHMVPANELMEKWAEEAGVPENKKGMFKGMSKAELESELAKLKKSGPHKKGSPEYTKEKELMFAIRAKTGWGKVD